MPTPKPYVTKTRRVLSDADILTIADEVVEDVDIEALKLRRRALPRSKAGPQTS